MDPVTRRILLAATSCWFATARLVRTFASAGCEVEIVCQAGHPVTKTRAASKIRPICALPRSGPSTWRLRLLSPNWSFRVMTWLGLTWFACIVVLNGTGAAGAVMRALLETSLGNPSTMSASTERSALMTIAHGWGSGHHGRRWFTRGTN